MRKALAILTVIVFAAFIFQPFGGEAASQVDKINKELAKVRQEMADAKQSRVNADKERENVLAQKEQTAKSINEIMAQIDTVGTQMLDTQQQIQAREAKLLQAGEELQAAEERIVNQDKLLQSRVRLMYTKGSVSYLDVLMSATSFTDFLDRFDALKSILGQDRELLDNYNHEKELVAAKKQEIETSLQEVRAMYGKLEDYKSLLVNKESEKEVMILHYNEKVEELEEISEKSAEQLMKLAKAEADLEEKKRKVKTYYTGGKLALPLRDSYTLSSGFGTRIHPVTGKRKTHNGIDMAAPKGTSIYAAESGVVIVAQWWSGYGYCVIINHGAGLWTLYGHIREDGIMVEKGQTVKRGQKIAEVGSTGVSTGNHLHFEVRKNEQPVNPTSYLR
ncbi:peptidoglycan DD-metalloendopeptidase family protein [Paenibacillus oenotherae]|uniref:Peptidoglycan DD-metalloendopeptidase family protein n=1 Tax=Paenibacillus oenotherae TaxID=1435645 RepID=A0ABS7D4Z5_9BACL|nr:peptidoglycan DD-metalloendopeptidase family protein [Paenibacillus oenotherae]